MYCLQRLQPLGLNLGEVGLRRLHAQHVGRGELAELDVGRQVLVRVALLQLLEERFQPLGPVGARARLHGGADHVGQLPQPHAAFVGRLGGGGDLLRAGRPGGP